MKLSHCPLAEYPGDLWQDWDLLNQRYCETHPLLQSRFVEPLTRHFPASIEVLSAHDKDECSALLLLQSTKGIIQSSYLPSQSQIALMLTPKNFPDFFDPNHGCISATVLRIDLFSIDPKYQAGVAQLSDLEITVNSTDIIINCEGNFGDYWSKRPKNLRKNISRYTNRVTKELGGYRLRIVSDAQAISDAVDRYGYLESQGWKGECGTALHPENVQGRFYSEVMENFARSGNAFVFELWAGDQMVASRLLIGNDNLLVVLKTTYSEALKQYSFGWLLLYETVKHIFDNRVAQHLDLYTDASKEQLDWSTESREFYNGSLYRRRAGSLMRQAVKLRKLVSAVS